jgi:hypothetical protein
MTQFAFALHQFTNFEDVPFEASDYSKLKFGSDIAARKFGYALAKSFFEKYSDKLMANDCVVIPSPYNFVKNAATLMTLHFVDALNELLVDANGNNVEYSIIHRKVSYTNDYGFLSKEKRKGLIDNDNFYLNKAFLKGKFLIFIDDVKITGTHEEKLKEVLADNKMRNEVAFLYFAEYFGDDPSIEAKLNFAGINSLWDYKDLSEEPNHQIIIRPIKYVLSQDGHTFQQVLSSFSKDKLYEIYLGSLAEGYYKIEKYQANLKLLKDYVKGK